MYELAKKSREAMKSKARRLAGETDRKTDSSDWSPAPLLRAEVKTGARPIMKPSSKGIGESNAARDTKAAIGDVKRGGFKSGGAVKDAGIKDKKALGAIDPSPKRAKAANYKHGGRTKREDGGKLPSPYEAMRSEERRSSIKVEEKNKLPSPKEAAASAARTGDAPMGRKYGGKTKGRSKKADGGFLSDLANALAGEGYIDGSTWKKKVDSMPTSSTSTASKSSRASSMASSNKPHSSSRSNMDVLTPAQAKRELAMGRKNMASDDETLTREQADRELEMGRQNMGMGRLISSVDGAKKGGKVMKRSARATGGRAKNKPSVSVNIITGGKTPTPGASAPMVPPRATPVPMPMAPGAPAGVVPPAPMPNVDPRNIQTPAARQAPIALKTGGRVTKKASSYKDMQAGAGSGEGRLQKTDIAEKRKGAPARKEGGRISKVAKSYKDMTAGAGSGEGRFQKTDIAKAKKGRAA